MVSGLRLLPVAFLQPVYLLNAGLEHSWSDLVFKQPKLRDCPIFFRSFSMGVVQAWK